MLVSRVRLGLQLLGEKTEGSAEDFSCRQGQGAIAHYMDVGGGCEREMRVGVWGVRESQGVSE